MPTVVAQAREQRRAGQGRPLALGVRGEREVDVTQLGHGCDGILTPGRSRLAALLTRAAATIRADSGATGCLPRSHRFPVRASGDPRDSETSAYGGLGADASGRGRAVVAHGLLEGLDDRRVELRAGVRAQLGERLAALRPPR